MDPRNDSFLGSEYKLSSSGDREAPSSPLSSVPGDFDYQQEYVPVNPAPQFESQPESQPTPMLTNTVADTIVVALNDAEPYNAHTLVRRSIRKRKVPLRFQQSVDLEGSPEPEPEPRPKPSELPVKRRKISPPKVSKPKVSSPETTRKTRARVRQVQDIVEPPNAVLLSPEPSDLQTSNDEFVDLMPIAQQVKESRIVKFRVDPERLGHILHVTAPSQSTNTSSPQSTPPTSPESEPEIMLPQTSPTSAADAHNLATLSVALTTRVPIDDKPLPRGQPDIWADTRHHLCESLSGLYASWQGSYYGKNGVAKAFMLDGNGHPRDHLDENVIILRASGSMAKDGDSGMKQREDQEQKHQYHAMVNAINQQSPIAVICGDKNIQVPSKMPHKYNSLDWYKATHVWTEKDRFNVIKYRLEKLDSSVTGWWVPEDSEPVVELGALGPPVKEHCGSCRNEYGQLYLCGWMCLNSRCQNFWRLSDGSTPDPTQLYYDPRFLKQKTPWANENAPLSFRFPLYAASAIAGEDYKMENLRGMTCPDCGKCNARVKWEGWECTGCGFEHTPKINPLPAAAIQDQNYPVSDSYPSSHDSALPHVKISVEFSHNYRWITYKFQVSAAEEGEVVHGIANKVVRDEPGGPNEMWEHLQVDCHGLVRRELSNALMNSFTINYGMPYKFIAAGDSLPFTAAPWPVTEAVSRLNWADRMTSGDAIKDKEKFNELYLVAYLQDQSMNYHDDGEKGLGSTVATLSLGGRADMGFKPKSPFYHGMKTIHYNKKRMTVMTMDDPLPEFPNYELRKQFIEEIRNANLPEDEEKARLAEMATALRAAYTGKKSHTKVDDYIKLSLGHGDIVIMRGAHLQKWFEHGVSPKGLMRFALTCRTVLPGHLKKSELPDYDVDLVQDEYDGSRIAK
ncbi:hypothetical protein AUEXF2481DRAFT_6368 [Aureobasidium subglaciale EXF-2481]|uniref:Alpha-ketoglutarate-dependent dioxygenase AlkB-like domain-containing protein n=1 Tax=Aureobasidium subglaciale (strain EXF-2481) TaxID=1043005 RepID=A0A074YCN0_AURSE|nr:uncharacterized protein AUEXF2481DRAFT_6368 [Aureobasidium subglaciale EXF-2481]KAI5208900.1 hypothetical protein E4T38_02625 [Aureobasidium subglaciale]KAI5227550.1 hypothetical protein E4T40_02551 [Aureobasidium subglaciale]KAI5231065.1 hypothetical protein E4T41_02624 [Aureobasidium subglaciale]KAI5265169.1 hypothetical protein E4T46_02402 [Aureobasidium subglaciale]KEQ93784.1 hypothetical protein AUEXF2481DRAFT_6368 [Aureobasidium subglaciale EXF-2481]